MMAKNLSVPKVSEVASEESVHQTNKRKAEELFDRLFGNKYKQLGNMEVFVPSYHMMVLKESFYNRGGNPLKAYSIADYSELLDIPQEYVERLVEENPGFFIFLHEKRTLAEEVDMLITVLARRLVNEVQDASVRDSAQALSVLSKFSSLVNPDKKKEESFDDLVAGLSSPEEVTSILDTYGFYKKDSGVDGNLRKEFDKVKSTTSNDIPTIKELLEDE